MAEAFSTKKKQPGARRSSYFSSPASEWCQKMIKYLQTSSNQQGVLDGKKKSFVLQESTFGHTFFQAALKRNDSGVMRWSAISVQSLFSLPKVNKKLSSFVGLQPTSSSSKVCPGLTPKKKNAKVGPLAGDASWSILLSSFSQTRRT